ncbi:hypothetical protein [Streptacidiphilus monticola]|uniref:Uncharacterized protein n=1 Tax=Streptacidiphilus monticola TaxID=2161674 RepID=A0ABW1FTW2_9ACTN
MIRILAHPRPVLPASLQLGVAFATALCAGIALASLLHGREGGLSLALLCIAAGYAACWARDVAAGLVVGPVFWLCYDGFVEHRYGVLGWHGASDLPALGFLCAAGLLPGLVRAVGLVCTVRRRFQRVTLKPFEPQLPEPGHPSTWN